MPEIKTALLSVSDRTGLVDFAKKLKEFGVALIASDGTAKFLKNNGVPCKSVSQYTGMSPLVGSRVKTLHPKIHAGILARRSNARDMKDIRGTEILPIDMVVVNLYPFSSVVSRTGATDSEICENIDIGGPTLLRAAAKNWPYVLAVSDTDDYRRVILELKKHGRSTTKEFNREFALKVFQRTAKYDSLIANYFANKAGDKEFPQNIQFVLEKSQDLSYGENPHQSAALYRIPANAKNKTGLTQFHGKQLSYNNILDVDSVLRVLADFKEQTCVIVKHTNPCGLASGKTNILAWRKALEGDPVSAFGSIVGFNRKVDSRTAKEISKLFVEVIVAPGFANEALEVLQRKKNLRILVMKGKFTNQLEYRSALDGILCQHPDYRLSLYQKTVTRRKPTNKELAALDFAWRVVKHCKSNAIVLATTNQVLGVGTGQMSRIDALRIAKYKLQHFFKGKKIMPLVMASDAFFPFPDSVREAHKIGVTAIIQPGGSIRDDQSIYACDQAGIAMVLTGMRHFRH